jgi:hypothetical protein
MKLYTQKETHYNPTTNFTTFCKEKTYDESFHFPCEDCVSDTSRIGFNRETSLHIVTI